MSTHFDQQIDAIFGAPEKLDVCVQGLGLLADALGPMAPEALCLVDRDGRVAADWSRDGKGVEPTAWDGVRDAQGDGIFGQSETEPCWLLRVALPSPGVADGQLLGRLDSSKPRGELQSLLADRVALLRVLGGVLLELTSQAEMLSDTDARLNQLTRQHETFQEEHRRIVAMNLMERDARLAEQRTYTARLQAEVDERTRQLLERSAALEESEARNRAIVDTAPDGIIMIDERGAIESFNLAAERIFGYRAEEVRGKNVSLLMPDDYSREHDGYLERYRRSGIKQIIGGNREVVGLRKDGTTFPLELAVGEIERGGIKKFTGIVRDITERKEAERHLREYARALEDGTSALEQATVQAEAASRSKSEFLANMSHEIRTPMTAIMGHADLLRDPRQTQDERTNSAEVIHRNADHLLQLINDILDLSKIESGKLNVEKIACSPCQVIAEVASMMRARAANKQLYFDVEYPGLVPETIESDPTRVRQILVNLVGNAIKFTKSGGIRVCCSLIDLPDAPNPRLRIAVADTGIGIAPDRLDRLFEPFVQADSSTTRVFGGTGLGLTISRRLARVLGGDIDVQSELGQGSTFTLTIETGSLAGARLLCQPREAEIREAFHRDNNRHSREVDTPSLSGRRILLAEDGQDNQDLISHHLRKAGAEVEIAENGSVAFEKALAAERSGRPYDLVFMDMQMPVMDGYTATMKLREQGYRHAVVALTAHAMVGDRDKCLAAGCDDYTTKPIDRIKLLQLAAQFECGRAKADTETPPPATRESGPERTTPIKSEFADDPAMAEVIERFLGRLSVTMETLDAAAEAADLERLRHVSHQLKGSAGGYGFPMITEKAAEVERLAKSQGDEFSVRRTVDELLALCRMARSSSKSSSEEAFVEIGS